MPLLTLLFFSLFAFGSDPQLSGSAKSSYPAQTFSALGVQQIKIVGVKGKLRLIASEKKTYKIKVKHSKGKQSDDWSLSVEKQGSALVLEVFNVAMGAQWENLVREESWPEFDIEIEGPSVPTVISWREGDLGIERWQSDIEAAFLKGQFRARRMRGQLKLQAVQAQVHIRQHEGQLLLKGEKGRVELSDTKGEVDINWLRGDLVANSISGKIRLEWPSGEVRLSEINGTLKANGASTEWHVSARSPSDVDVRSQSGPVAMRWRGGAKVFLTTTSGDLKVTKGLIIENREDGKVMEATTGGAPRGTVFVRTQAGNISWQ